jgi:hypothetical protein
MREMDHLIQTVRDSDDACCQGQIKPQWRIGIGSKAQVGRGVISTVILSLWVRTDPSAPE